MFDIGFWELALISILGLVVLGPERLPHAIRSISGFIRSAKDMANNIKDELNQELSPKDLQKNLSQEVLGVEDFKRDLESSLEYCREAAKRIAPPQVDMESKVNIPKK